MVKVQPQGSHPKAGAHLRVTLALGHKEIDPAGKKSGQQNETFCRRYESEGLIDELAGDGEQVGERHPHQHESAGCIEFQSPLHESRVVGCQIARLSSADLYEMRYCSRESRVLQMFAQHNYLRLGNGCAACGASVSALIAGEQVADEALPPPWGLWKSQCLG